jgi:hypothetical protein
MSGFGLFCNLRCYVLMVVVGFELGGDLWGRGCSGDLRGGGLQEGGEDMVHESICL